MKKLTFLLILGTVLLASPCYAQTRRVQVNDQAEETSSNIVVVECKEQTIYVAIYGLPECPTGYFMYNPKLNRYDLCEDDLNSDIANGVYNQLEDDQDLSIVGISCKNT